MELKLLQDKIEKFVEENNLDSKPEFRFIDLVSEMGELGKEVLKNTNYGKDSFKNSEELKLELGDVLYSLIVLSNKLNIDLEEALDSVLKKYQRRLAKGSAGSEVEEK